jgi:deoxyribodipyrimidine photo-lyase
LARVQPARYAKSRNHLNGAVTGLSPYIRHGVLTLAEVKQAVFERIRRRDDGGKLINELGWRDFWQRMWLDLGDGIHDDQEAFKTGYDASSYTRELPQDVRDGRTGLACMDGFRDELVTTGWLHNHARMWMAAWLVHWRRVHWTAGANWFLEHLLDGDPASNHLSWQWVASSFSHKPYFFNRGNLERYSDGRYCEECPSAADCPFEGSYDQLESQLFAPMPAIRDTGTGRNRQRRNGGGASAALARPKR